jgi:hypothetical protein
MTFEQSSVKLTLPLYHAVDMFQKVGGIKTAIAVEDSILVTDDDGQTSSWTLTGYGGLKTFTFTLIRTGAGPYIYTLILYEDGIEVASGYVNLASDTITLTESNSSGIFGTVDIDYTADVTAGNLFTNLTNVDTVFLPGIIDGTDSDVAARYQYRKVFIFNTSAYDLTNCKIWGININSNNIVKLALEKDLSQAVILNGEEVIKNYTTEPKLFGSYTFNEVAQIDALDIGNSGVLPAGSCQGIWLRQECLQGSSGFAQDSFQIGFDYDDDLSVSHNQIFLIKHTRLERTTVIINNRSDIFNPMTVLVDFTYEPPVGYYKRTEDIIFGVYIDKEFVEEVVGRLAKVQLKALDVVSVLEIFAHPHPGFQFIRERTVPGNKIIITFRAKDPTKRDIQKHNIYWDNGTGNYLAKRVGEIDALTGAGTGSLIKSASRI